MNFKSNLFIAKALSCNIERFIEQYLDEELSDTNFRELCLAQIDEIIEVELESIVGLKVVIDLIFKKHTM